MALRDEFSDMVVAPMYNTSAGTKRQILRMKQLQLSLLSATNQRSERMRPDEDLVCLILLL